MESQRQKKIGGLIQQDLADILQRAATEGSPGTLISVSKVSVTVDLSIAKVYVSVFPTAKAVKIVEEIKASTPAIRHELAQRTKHQLRRTPELLFFLDDSLDYIEKIDQSLKEGENPIEKPDILPRRKKS
ncbi:30S ribosome-binding factor RbfA [Lentiprolixibacter aurantiacus]|uniref:Ribosome-binding factor A n=1 Tax=Lentiprolixibacter aurantiacus TaxID=2993939 RepID=A0AAE3SM91_9FLAO|nr:30S ribosome-binding factor RbfA [Lentiprolixibacter aurantiacus]MCX2718482.1 30S ribosome-binding factor RbfA [Lentiprolixibacter aurantiacus]